MVQKNVYVLCVTFEPYEISKTKIIFNQQHYQQFS